MPSKGWQFTAAATLSVGDRRRPHAFEGLAGVQERLSLVVLLIDWEVNRAGPHKAGVTDVTSKLNLAPPLIHGVKSITKVK